MKYITVFLLLVITATATWGQTYKFPRHNMVQGIRYSGNWQNPSPLNRSIVYAGDTVMCDTIYSKYCSLAENNNYTCGTGNYSVFTRMDGDKMYLLEGGCENSEYIMYDWGIKAGHKFIIYPSTLIGGPVIVDSVFAITTLDGQQRTYIHMYGTGGHNSGVIYRWVEGIGDIDRGFFAKADFEGGADQFVCHKENGAVVWQSSTNSQECDSLVSFTGIAETWGNQLEAEIYPNPFSNTAILQATQYLNGAGITIYNTFGQYLREVNGISGKNFTIQRGDLPAGIYFIQIKEDHKILAVKKLMVAD